MTTTVLLVGLLAAAPLQHPHQETEPRAGRRDALPVLSLEEVALRSYAVQHVDAEELAEHVRGIVGRMFLVEERGGSAGSPVFNVTSLGSQVLVFDTPEYCERVLETCRTLDRLPEQGAAGSSAMQLVSTQFRPRFIALDAALDALAPFRSRAGGSIRAIEAGNALLIRDDPETTREILGLLEAIDVPAPQVRLVVQLVLASQDGRGGTLPADLVENLGRLVPDQGFGSVGFAMLQTSVRPSRRRQMRIEGAAGAYEFVFQPVAHDPDTGALTVQDCTLRRLTTSQGVQDVFSTGTTLLPDQYNVIGAAGAEPLFFVVIRLEPLG